MADKRVTGDELREYLVPSQGPGDDRRLPMNLAIYDSIKAAAATIDAQATENADLRAKLAAPAGDVVEGVCNYLGAHYRSLCDRGEHDSADGVSHMVDMLRTAFRAMAARLALDCESTQQCEHRIPAADETQELCEAREDSEGLCPPCEYADGGCCPHLMEWFATQLRVQAARLAEAEARAVPEGRLHVLRYRTLDEAGNDTGEVDVHRNSVTGKYHADITVYAPEQYADSGSRDTWQGAIAAAEAAPITDTASPDPNTCGHSDSVGENHQYCKLLRVSMGRAGFPGCRSHFGGCPVTNSPEKDPVPCSE